LTCDLCRETVDAVVQVETDHADEYGPTSICRECAARMVRLFVVPASDPHHTLARATSHLEAVLSSLRSVEAASGCRTPESCRGASRCLLAASGHRPFCRDRESG
jgi:hypothetical protein